MSYHLVEEEGKAGNNQIATTSQVSTTGKLFPNVKVTPNIKTMIKRP